MSGLRLLCHQLGRLGLRSSVGSRTICTSPLSSVLSVPNRCLSGLSSTSSRPRKASSAPVGPWTKKVASKRKTKKYKLKTHQGAAARWMVLANGLFKRGQAGRNHFNRKMRSWKKKSKRTKMISTTMQARRLKKLMPYFKKKYMKR